MQCSALLSIISIQQFISPLMYLHCPHTGTLSSARGTIAQVELSLVDYLHVHTHTACNNYFVANDYLQYNLC